MSLTKLMIVIFILTHDFPTPLGPIRSRELPSPYCMLCSNSCVTVLKTNDMQTYIRLPCTSLLHLKKKAYNHIHEFDD